MSEIFDQAIQKTDEDIKLFVEHSFKIANRIYHILIKQNMNKRDLASLLNKKDSEVDRFLSGTHNFTLREISEIEGILKERII